MQSNNDFTMIFDRLNSLSDGTTDGVNELIFLYLKSMSGHREEIMKAVKSADLKKVERVAHTACGLNEMIGAFILGFLFRDLELSASTGQSSSVESVLKKINGEFDLVRGRFIDHAESLTLSSQNHGDRNAP